MLTTRLMGQSRTFTTSLRDLWPSLTAVKQRAHQGRLVIIGSGWAGYKLLKSVDKVSHHSMMLYCRTNIPQDKYQVSVISPKNYFTFTPLLPSTSVGTLEFRSAVEPVRGTSGVEFNEATCQSIDFDARQIECVSVHSKEKFSIPYDRLIIACGSVPNTFNVPGVKEHASFLKDISHARQIRSRLLESTHRDKSCSRSTNHVIDFEKASQPTCTPEERDQLLHFAVVGAGPTGVEFCAELSDFVSDDVSRRFAQLKHHVRITLYDVAPRILPTFDHKLSTYTTRRFEAQGIRVQTGKAVGAVHEKFFELKDGTSVPYGLLVWSTGLAPNVLIESLDLPKDRMHRLKTNEYLQVLNQDGCAMQDVYAVGDCAVVDGYDLPCTAQVAKQKAQYLVSKLNKMVAGSSTDDVKYLKPFQYQHRGSMAYVGSNKAVVDFDKGKQRKGTLGWIIWRGAYMGMATSLRNKIKIPTYWLLTWLSGRELSRF